MTELVLALDALYALREAAPSPDIDPAAAVKLAELAGVGAVRVGEGVAEADVYDLRRVARRLELKVPPSPLGIKLALEVRPDRVIWTSLDDLAPALRALSEAGIPAHALVVPDVDAVKAAHAAGVTGIEFVTTQAVDLPRASRDAVLERLSDAAKLAAKLRVPSSMGGGLDFRSLPLFVRRAPALGRVAVGRALLGRALLVGMDRAVRDLRALLP